MATETPTKRDRILTHAQNTLFSFHVMLTSGVRDSLRGSKGQRQQECSKDNTAFRESWSSMNNYPHQSLNLDEHDWLRASQSKENKQKTKSQTKKNKQTKTSQFNNPQLALLQNHPSIRGWITHWAVSLQRDLLFKFLVLISGNLSCLRCITQTK